MADISEKLREDILRPFAKAWNNRDIDILMSFMKDDCLFIVSMGPDICVARYTEMHTVRTAFSKVFTTFPDAHWSGGHHFIFEDRGVSEWTVTDTRANVTRVEVNRCDIFTFRGNKIAIKDSFRKNRTSRLV